MLSLDQSIEVGNRLHSKQLVLFWIGWVLLVAYTLGVFFGSLPFYFTHLQTVCAHNPCVTGQPLPNTVILLHGHGLSLTTYALFAIVLTVIAAIIAFMIAGVLAWRKSEDWMALLTALALVMLITANSTFTLEHLDSPWKVPATLLNILTWSLVLLVFCLIPDGQFVPKWTRLLPIIWIIFSICFLFINQLHSNTFLANIVWLTALACLVVSLLYRYRIVSTPVQRQQTKWIVFGGSTTVLLTIVTSLPPLFFPSFAGPGTLYDVVLAVFNIFLLLPFILCIAIAILRYRLWDIDIIINRTLLYSTLTIVLAVIYEVSVFTLQSITGGFIRGNQLAIVASTFLIGTLFKPLHGRTQKLIDRHFYRRKYDAARTLATFSATIRDEVDLNQLCAKLIEVVDETMQPAHISLWLRNTESSRNRKTRQLTEIDEE
jgi:hypothetical protein